MWPLGWYVEMRVGIIINPRTLPVIVLHAG
jgi:hypothetical protein